MGILQDIADDKPLQESPAETAELLAQIKQSVDAHLAASAENTNILNELKAKAESKIADCDTKIAQLEAEMAGRKAPERPTGAQESAPPPLRPTAPLEYLMNERTQKRAMEDGTWLMNIIIETLNIDDLVRPSDFANNVAYQNHRAHILRSTPPDTFPGFCVKVKVGLVTCGKRVIKPCVSKEDAMHSAEFISTLSAILVIIKQKSGLPA